MRWRPQMRRRAGSSTDAPVVAVVVRAVPVLAVVVIALIVIASHRGRPGVDAFNACISHKRFLVAKRHRLGHRVIDTIKDRATGVLAGVFAVLPSAAATFTSTIGPPSGTGESNGRMVLFTKVPTGRDTNAILTCGFPEFPITP